MPEEAAAFIDSCDVVIRFNDCRSAGAGGRKTDVVAVCNTGRPGKDMVSASGWRNNGAVHAASEIWCVRDPLLFAAMKPVLERIRPDLDDFCDDYTEGFAALAQAGGKKHVVIGRSVHDRLDTLLRNHSPGEYVVPSSGLVVIGHVLSDEAYRNDEILITGFGHEGWDGHPFAAEKRLVNAWEGEGRLKRLNGTQFYSPAEGA